jgi:hypothetical protein
MVRLSKAATRPLLWGDGTGSAEVLWDSTGSAGWQIMQTPAEVAIETATTADRVGPGCGGVVAESPDWLPIDIRTCRRSRPARLVWGKRPWRCRDALSAESIIVEAPGAGAETLDALDDQVGASGGAVG